MAPDAIPLPLEQTQAQSERLDGTDIEEAP